MEAKFTAIEPGSPAIFSQADQSQTPGNIFSAVRLNQEEQNLIAQSVPGGITNIVDVLPLTPLQEGMLFHSLLNDRDTYIISALLELPSHEQRNGLVGAVEKLIEYHSGLRSLVLWNGLPQPVQVFCRTADLAIGVIAFEVEDELHHWTEECTKPGGEAFDIRSAPLLRLRMASVASGKADEKCYALLQVHHLICDMQSFNGLLSDLIDILEHRGFEFPAVELTEKAANRIWAPESAKEIEAFFRKELGDFSAPTTPWGVRDIGGSVTRHGEAVLALSRPLSTRLRTEARRAHVSSARLFHAAWALVMAQTCDADDVVFGTVIRMARKPNSARESHSLSLNINTLPLRVSLRHATAKTLVQEVDAALSELIARSQTPITLAHRCSGIASATPLFTAIINYRHNEMTVGRTPDGGCVKLVARADGWTNYPLTVTVDSTQDDFSLTVQTYHGIDPAVVAECFEKAVSSLIDALEHSPNTPAALLEVLSSREMTKILELACASPYKHKAERQIHELFAEQVARTPDTIAVVCEGFSLTFEELNRKAAILAARLQRLGICADRLVGLCARRGPETVIGIFGILMSGGAYVPLDESDANDRLAHICRDASLSVLLRTSDINVDWLLDDITVIEMDCNSGDEEAHHYSLVANKMSSLGFLAYVIYTSGSTGLPKGVMIDHRSVVSLWRSHEQMKLGRGSWEKVAMNASINFDASVAQLMQLLSGRTIVVIPQQARVDVSQLVPIIDRAGIEEIDCTPSELAAWMAGGLFERRVQRTLRILVGGELLNQPLWDQARLLSGTDIYDLYGPTECTVDVTCARVSAGETVSNIGRPIQGKNVYVLNKFGRLVPCGVPGEIYVGAAGLARGYIGQPGLTAERFGADPFDTQWGARMYKTGDVGRWCEDGSLQYLGRIDHQVKLRGHRVEMGEIEANLRNHNDVKDCVIALRGTDRGSTELVAYITLRGHARPSVNQFAAYLSRSLPPYMVPTAFVIVDKMPLTVHGKVNRDALPTPGRDSYPLPSYAEPVGRVEEALACIWKELLEVGKIGREDNFFGLGGHSLQGIRLVGRIFQELFVQVSVAEVLRNPTLNELAHLIERRQEIKKGVSDLRAFLSEEGAL
jgi:amino acid adenylation domain-containing protein